MKAHEPQRELPVQPADDVRCSDCDATLERDDAYEIREPHVQAAGVVSARLFWVCPKCWERMIGRAVLSAVRGF